MSRVLEQLKKAERDRERVIAERKRLESEADAAQAARDRAEREATRDIPMPKPAPAPTVQGRKLPFGMATLILIGGISIAMFFAGEDKIVNEPVVPVAAPKATPFVGAITAPPAPAVAAFELKLDRDLESFGRRLQGKQKP
jgi:hypothetical protein